jgi:hypothetical protein
MVWKRMEVQVRGFAIGQRVKQAERSIGIGAGRGILPGGLPDTRVAAAGTRKRRVE